MSDTPQTDHKICSPIGTRPKNIVTLLTGHQFTQDEDDKLLVPDYESPISSGPRLSKAFESVDGHRLLQIGLTFFIQPTGVNAAYAVKSMGQSGKMEGGKTVEFEAIFGHEDLFREELAVLRLKNDNWSLTNHFAGSSAFLKACSNAEYMKIQEDLSSATLTLLGDPHIQGIQRAFYNAASSEHIIYSTNLASHFVNDKPRLFKGTSLDTLIEENVTLAAYDGCGTERGELVFFAPDEGKPFEATWNDAPLTALNLDTVKRTIGDRYPRVQGARRILG